MPIIAMNIGILGFIKMREQLSGLPVHRTVPSRTYVGLTSEFEKGSGGTQQLWPFEKKPDFSLYKCFGAVYLGSLRRDGLILAYHACVSSRNADISPSEHLTT